MMSQGSYNKFKPIELDKQLTEHGGMPLWHEVGFEGEDGARLVRTGKHRAMFLAGDRIYYLERHFGLTAKAMKYLPPLMFIGFAWMAYTVGSSTMAYINAAMALLQFVAGACHISLFRPPPRCAKVMGKLSVMPLLATSGMLLMVAYTGAVVAHDAHPDIGWICLLWHQKRYIFSAISLPAFYKLSKWGETEQGRKFLLNLDSKSHLSNSNLMFMAMGCFMVAVGTFFGLALLVHGAIVGSSKTMLSTACGGSAGILNLIKSQIEKNFDNIEFAPEEDMDDVMQSRKLQNGVAKSNWGQRTPEAEGSPHRDSFLAPLLEVAAEGELHIEGEDDAK